MTSDETWIYEATGTAVAGQYANIGNVTGNTPSNNPVTDDDPSHYFGESGPINIKKYTNDEDADSPPGPFIPVGGAVTWSYVVTTTSNVPLHNIEVTDSEGGVIPVYISGDTNGDDLLTSDETWIYEATGTAVAGQYANIGNVTGNTPSNQPVTDDDPSHYYGEIPETGVINIKKYTNDEDADSPPGPFIPVGGAVTWSYVVTTTSNVPLHNIEVTDSEGGVIPVYISGDDNNDGNLTSDETWIYEATGIAIAGQYANIGYVSGETPKNQIVTDDDPSHYYNEPASINIIKYTNGEDADSPPGPYIPVGGNVTWRYVVTTTSNVPIASIKVTDSVPGVNPVYISGDTNGYGLLTSDESWIYEATGIAIAGQYANVGNVTGKTPHDEPVTNENPSHYFGELGTINIKKYTNGEDADSPPGPYIPKGQNVTWRYVVTTDANVPIRSINVTDSVPGVNPVYISGDTNGDGLLTSDESWIYEATGIAIVGQYANIGTVTRVSI